MKKTISKLKKELDTIFSVFIRLRSANEYGMCQCFTCGKVIGDKWEQYNVLVRELDDDAADKRDQPSPEFKAMEQLCITRMCCRRHFLTNIDIVDKI